MAAVSITMGKLIAGVVIAILASSAISVGVSTMLAVGPVGPEGPQGDTGPQGIQGIQGEKGETGPQGPKGDTGAMGATGATGATGPQGPAGVNGATWWNGTGTPSSGLGSDGDFYLDLGNSDVYNKVSGSWMWVANIQGATGPAGATGAQGPQGIQGDPGIGFAPQGNISVSAFAFVPSDPADNVSYLQDYGLRNLNTANPVVCMAPLQLPQGATITNVTFYFHDLDPLSYFQFYMLRENQSGTTQMGYVDNAPAGDMPGDDHISFDFIVLPFVENNGYFYYLRIVIPWSSDPFRCQFHYAFIEYEYPA